MNNFLSGTIMGFREGLEAFLIIAIMIQYLKKLKKNQMIKYIWFGVLSGIVLSVLVGLILNLVSGYVNNTESFTKLWESGSSFAALLLVTGFIIWMIKHGSNMVSHVKDTIDLNMSSAGIFLVALTMVSREGAEIAIFTFAGKYSLISTFTGVFASLILTVLIFYSLIKVNLKVIFNITLGYLILQAGFLLGYSIHEGLSAFKDIGMIAKDSILLNKAFNFEHTVLDHKNGILGLPLYILVGWYSRPEWIQFIVQYSYTVIMLMFWFLSKRKSKKV
ncbi:FTR1 family protein [Paludicola sp. MB14-C6]|uniref:FTR1 family iron permease n=1 Tax=Paludihabitans sp. MB14-C6 TaxID=3070656 RepID=UPI0027DDD975|nr:FTR1 family protein [Paludicola sp. MB14-C6]WMJ24277.1 FTR1 family protein [Paludicola sp. MB14-C6]